jgi:hypothetical protein
MRLVLQVEHCEEVMLVSGYKEGEQVQLNIYIIAVSIFTAVKT